MGIGGVVSLLWFQRSLPPYVCKFFEMCLMVTADHGPAVSGAHNTIVCARAGKDLVSSLVSGLLTIVSKHLLLFVFIISQMVHFLFGHSSDSDFAQSLFKLLLLTIITSTKFFAFLFIYFWLQGDRFGGALDGAAKQFSEAYDSGLIPMEFVNSMRKKGQLIMGIGHRVKSV